MTSLPISHLLFASRTPPTMTRGKEPFPSAVTSKSYNNGIRVNSSQIVVNFQSNILLYFIQYNLAFSHQNQCLTTPSSSSCKYNTLTQTQQSSLAYLFMIDLYATPSPHKPSLWTTALTLEANSWTESHKILFATSSPASAQDTTVGTRAAMRAQDVSA